MCLGTTAALGLASQPVPPAQKATGSSEYLVVKGDNDWTIAAKLGCKPSELRSANPGIDWNNLQLGTKLVIPTVAKAAPAPSGKTTAGAEHGKRMAIAKTDVSVRTGPSTDHRRRTLVQKGVVATVIGKSGDWYQLRFSTGLEGWVRGDMLKGATATPPAAKKTTTPPMSAAASKTLLDTAKSLMGIRYRWGGMSRSGFDCSGFTTYVFGKHGIKIPRTSITQSKHGAFVARADLAPGDLVFFKTTRRDRVSHVGIYIGDNKFIHASSGGNAVRIDSLGSRYYNSRYAGARRVPGSDKIAITAKQQAPTPEPEPKEEPNPEPELPTDEPAEPTTDQAFPSPSVMGTTVTGR